MTSYIGLIVSDGQYHRVVSDETVFKIAGRTLFDDLEKLKTLLIYHGCEVDGMTLQWFDTSATIVPFSCPTTA